MLGDRLSCSKTAGNSRRTTLSDREKRIDDPLARNQRFGYPQPFEDRTGLAHGPLLDHGDLVRSVFRFNDSDRIENPVIPLSHNR